MNSITCKSKSFKYLMWTVLILTAQRIIVQYFNPVGLVIAIIAFALFANHIMMARKSYSLRNIDKDSRFIVLCLIIWSLIIMFRVAYFQSFFEIKSFIRNRTSGAISDVSRLKNSNNSVVYSFIPVFVKCSNPIMFSIISSL